MKVLRAKSAGFCWGVERAIEITRDYAHQGRKPVYTDGPLIHNRQMMEKLSEEGIREVGDYQSRANIAVNPAAPGENPVMVVRAHGISPERRNYLKSLGMDFKDATCPDVGIIAGKIRLHAKKGYATIIFGDKNHPEAIGLLGYTEGRGYCITSKADIDALPALERVCMVSQSTMFMHEFAELSEYARQKFKEVLVFDTICQATKDRQTDVVALARQGAQAIVVIGGHHSANTVKLASLARLQNLPTYHIETAAELSPEEMKKFTVIGVTAGASTPEFLISEVCAKLEAL
ncbi:4-hydroxy-3-methylbut-2-enyl diphosphate reductase [Opitutus terrae]|uniref:4-hydroxy-3-methylbut-2-enyl diphosphate reductase n=1 Tax=Opitutus terrae (strain DSM 11246 / JCM 15787 / PB90-1) TaxID=452637 RepID=ISPH_OPITP|nr:4-hydroxy-3-methylbut-2-enyl diphosphate reductase [Opitutus terrae]B1ZXD4.1 RecName: Full=4-hydroxy-3-methylbut-2-enyl diphosphate reductase; Short=HMBPP reductase [Opitutus terrae PB90-1]ACB76929.1 hydroxymethylbutenyl pyrophosphate reductase [Opitutus terrae PB90-1]